MTKYKVGETITLIDGSQFVITDVVERDGKAYYKKSSSDYVLYGEHLIKKEATKKEIVKTQNETTAKYGDRKSKKVHRE